MLVHNLTKVALLGASWVMYLLVALSVISLGVMFERWLFFRKHRGDAEALGQKLVRLLRRDDRRGAEQLLKNDPTLEAHVLQGALEWIDGGPDAVEEALESSMGRERKNLERGLTFLGTLGNNAPFVGLLGTVIGVIQAFHQLGQGNNQEAMGNVMVGISEALVATGVGLLVALPAVVAFNVGQRKVNEIESNVSMITKHLLALLRSEHKMVSEFRALSETPPRESMSDEVGKGVSYGDVMPGAE